MNDSGHICCWHIDSGVAYTFSYPPQYKEVCCHCGNTRRHQPPKPQPPPGHGPHHPSTRQWPSTYATWNTTSTHTYGGYEVGSGGSICSCGDPDCNAAGDKK
jgi:hypothetical protein